jgi:hypothetical protein
MHDTIYADALMKSAASSAHSHSRTACQNGYLPAAGLRVTDTLPYEGMSACSAAMNALLHCITYTYSEQLFRVVLHTGLTLCLAALSTRLHVEL